MYRICSNKSPGFYFLPGSGDPASKWDWRLSRTDIYLAGLAMCARRMRVTFHINRYLSSRWSQSYGIRVMMVMASQVCYRYEKASVIPSHHVYKAVWTPVIGELNLKWTSSTTTNDQLPYPQKAPGIYWLQSVATPWLQNETSIYSEGASIRANTVPLPTSRQILISLELSCIRIVV